MQMLSSLPEEMLDMPVGEYIERAEADSSFKAQWADRAFVFSDKYNLVTKPESNEGSSSSDEEWASSSHNSEV